MDEDKIRELLEELDDIAREFDHYEYGLPLYGETLEKMIQAVKKKTNG